MPDVHPPIDAFDEDAPTRLVSRDGPDFVQAPSDRPSPHEDASRTVLEVHQTWGSALLDTVHLADRPLTVGHRSASLGGPSALARMLPFAPVIGLGSRPAEIADLPAPDGLADAPAPVFQPGDGGWEVLVRSGWDLDVVLPDGTVQDLEALAADDDARTDGDTLIVPLPPGATATLRAGEVALVAREVPASRRVRAVPFGRVDVFFLGLLGLSAFMGASFLALVAAMPPAPTSSMTDRAEAIARVLRLPPPEPEPEAPPEQAAPSKGGQKTKALETPDRKAAKRATPNPRDNADQERMNKEVAMNAGLLGAAAELGGMEGMGGLDAGALDGIRAPIAKTGGRRGEGHGWDHGGVIGGDGTADGIGGVRGRCEPGQICGPGGTGVSQGGSWTKTSGTVGLRSQEVIAIGSLTRAEIDEVVKRHMKRIRYCYSRELQKEPSLRGKLVTRFVIASDGTVASANKARSNLDSDAVTRCVNETVYRMRFPEPRGGGQVVVSYPFVFDAG